MEKIFIQHNFLIATNQPICFFSAKLKEQAEIGKEFKISTKKLTTSDIGPPTNARKIQSSQISTTTVDHIDKPVQNVEKQGKFKKWFGKIFPSSSSKPNKNEKLTTKDIGQAKDTIPSTTTTNADHLDKPIELSEWIPQTPTDPTIVINT